jgi:hypothetical protein
VLAPGLQQFIGFPVKLGFPPGMQQVLPFAWPEQQFAELFMSYTPTKMQQVPLGSAVPAQHAAPESPSGDPFGTQVQVPDGA